jgi:quercetin dioxygenase-like cupin family protein
MPLYTRETLKTKKLPWVEIDDFEFFHLGRQRIADPGTVNDHKITDDGSGHVPYWGYYQDRPLGATRRIEPTTPKDRIVVVSGVVQVETEFGRTTLNKRDYFDIPASGATLTNTGTAMAEIGRVMGHWEHSVRSEICMFDPEHPCDTHYHDGDEYWVIFRGHFTLDYHGRKIKVGPGTLMAAGKGYEHGAENVEETMNGLVIAMPLEDAQRDGHLNRERQGAPTPGREVPQEVWGEIDAHVAAGTEFGK